MESRKIEWKGILKLASETVWRETVLDDKRISEHADIHVRSISELETGPKRLIDAIFFEGLDVLHCLSGQFRFSFDDRTPIALNAGETLVIYPHHKVTIDAVEVENKLIYGIFGGRDLESYFDSLGFFDCAKGKTEPHCESWFELRRQLKLNFTTGTNRQACRSFMTDLLVSYLHEMRGGGVLIHSFLMR